MSSGPERGEEKRQRQEQVQQAQPQAGTNEEKKAVAEEELTNEEIIARLLNRSPKLWGRWSYEGVKVSDPSLVRYINVKPRYFPHTFGRHAKIPFGKAEVPIVERLINRLMSPGREPGTPKSGRVSGKKFHAMRIVYQAFEIIEKRTGENPIQMLVRAIENVAPREDTIALRVGGIIRRYAVDVSPQRRVDVALKLLVAAARQRAWRSPLSLAECLAEEIILAARGSLDSIALRRKVEIERIAEASR